MKNQLKKSLSLIMAVMMLLSCWVWVAPDEAEAAGQTTNYYIRMKYNCHNNWSNGAGNYKVRVYYKTLNGTTGGTAYHEVVPGQKWCEGEGEQWIVGGADTSVKIPGFPTKVEVYYSTAATRDYEWNNGILEVSGDGNTWYTAVSGMSISTGCGNTKTVTVGTVGNDKYPKIASFTTPAAIEANLNKIGGANITVTPQIIEAKDQYGVSWEATFPTSGFTHTIVNDANGAAASTNVKNNLSVSGTSNKPTVTAKPGLQLYGGDGASSSTYYVKSDYSGTYGKATTYTKLTFKHPVYKATFYANGEGALIGPDNNSGATEIILGGDEGKLYYGTAIGKAPAYASKPGFEFKGFYSTRNADATGLTASFSGTQFVDNSTKVPSTGDSTWYAAWQSSPITATFLTADNQLIGTVEGRYNNYLTAANMYNGQGGLNAAVKAAYTGTGIQFNGNVPVYKDGATEYTFSHWKIIEAYDESVVDYDEDTVLKGDVTFQAVYTVGTAKKYTVTFKDAAGATISTKSDYKFRDSVIIPSTVPTKAQDDKYSYEFIGWAKDIGKNFYAVDENDMDENGAVIAYTHKDGAEFTVRADATYVPVFRMTPRTYKVTYNYTVDGGTTASTYIDGFHWEDNPTMPEIKDNYTVTGFRYYLIGWKVGNGATQQLEDIVIKGDTTITAVYGNRESAKYTINFYGKAEDGVTDVHLNPETNTYEHNDAVTAPAVEQKIDTEDALYTFAGWSPAVNTTAGADAEYYATYTKQTYADVYFYNYDGTLFYSVNGKEAGKFVGDTIPAFTNLVEGVETDPAKPEDVVGTYKFTGWADANGNTVVPGTDKFTGDTYLYAQFDTIYKDYTITFDPANGNAADVKKYHYGDPITIPADPTKAEDVEFTYDFKTWTPEVSEVCYGDATYTATYVRAYKYYKVHWLNDKKTEFTTSNYPYNAKIQQANIDSPAGLANPEQGFEWALDEWIQCNAAGQPINAAGEVVAEENAARFVRGMRIGSADLYFYAKFKQVPLVHTVTFFKEDGTTLLGTAKVPHGEALAAYAEAFEEKAPKAPDETNHYIIEKWVNVTGGADVVNVNADVSVKPSYKAERHNKQVYEVIAEPTCNVPGYAHYKCLAPECTLIDYNVEIPVIDDMSIPTGQFYVGTDKWTAKQFADATIDYSDVKFVGPNTNVIVNAEDSGTRTMPWNTEAAKSRGVGKMEYYISENAVQIVPANITSGWTEIYNYETMRVEALAAVLKEENITEAEYEAYAASAKKEDKMKKAEIDRRVDELLSIYYANATGVLSNLNLVDGKEYIIYIKISDRAPAGAEANVCYLSSGKLHYGAKAADIKVEGNGHGTKFCAEATITVTDDNEGFTVYVDGAEVALDDDGKYVSNEKGVHTVTVVDKNGNKTTKTFEIKGNHTYRHYVTAATCANAGSRYDVCTLCGEKANETVIPALGHSYTVNFIDTAATCIVDGYRTYSCDNNCGTKLVLKPTDDAATVAQAKKWNETAGADGKGDWVALTVADLAHLKATGVHTYAKVKDENGDDTEEDAWIIDKAATCTVAGSKHKDCTVCGARVTDEIPLDTVNGHNFYRPAVAVEPTCTTEGKSTKTCRYCGHQELVEYLPALGHTPGEYKIITEAVCEGEGKKILTCAVCTDKNGDATVIGEPIEDENGNVIGYDAEKYVYLPALGHAWKAEGVPYEKDGKWYQKYVCANDNTHTKEEVAEGYEPPVAATATFMNGDAEHTTVKGFVKDTLTMAQTGETPVKAADKTYKYTFKAWATRTGEGTEESPYVYTEVQFPVKVEGDATYYAVYNEKYINYTITYYKEDGTTEYKKTGYLHNGEEYELANGPAKADDKTYTYTFAGWKDKATDTVYADTETAQAKIKIDGANINLVATYDTTKKTYAVTFANSASDIIETIEVKAGDNVTVNGVNNQVFASRKADSKYHYEFRSWNKAAALEAVYSNIYTTPNFDAVEHNFEVVPEVPATCTTNRVDKYICEGCGYYYTMTVSNSALGHNWGTPKFDEETGKSTQTCQREGCGATQEDAEKYSVKFYVEGELVKTVNYNTWGSTLPASKLPATPVKEQDATHTYTFKGWAVKGTPDVVDVTAQVIKADVEYEAIFTATVRKYTVIFAYNASNVIEVHKDVAAGSNVTYAGETPVKAFDANYHYTFSNWAGMNTNDNTVENVQADITIYAEFTKTEHAYDDVEKLEDANCEHGEGTRYLCSCGKYYDVTGKPLPHELEVVEKIEATADKDGYIKYKCKKCEYTEEEILKFVDNSITITVNVKHNDAPKSGIRVEIQAIGGGEPIVGTTNANGVATFQVDKDSVYTCWVTIDGTKYEVALENASGGNLVGNYSYTDQADCHCACHRDNVWGAIFRFFHKIIKLITGEYKCCGNPDPMYG